jgi:outer membrane protein insertion porin family
MSHSYKKPSSLLLLLIFISWISSLFAQDIKNENKFYIEKISVEGNSKTRLNVIYENLAFAVGDSLTEDQITAGIENLKRTEFFDEVTLSPRPGSKPGNLNLTIRVDEHYWPSIRFKGGFSELDGWYITPLSLNFDTIFGFGNLTSLDLTIGDRIASILLIYINPNIFNSDFDFHLRLGGRTRQYVHYIEGIKLIQNVAQGGYFVGLRSRDSFFRHFLFGWDVYTSEPDSVARGASSDEKFYIFPEPLYSHSKDKILTSAFSLFFNWDKRLQPNYPIGGWWIGFWFTQAGEQLGSTSEFSRLVVDVRKYTLLYNRLSLAARLKFGSVSSSAPFYEKFYLGGPNSLRGYPDRSISPLGGGDRLIRDNFFRHWQQHPCERKIHIR